MYAIMQINTHKYGHGETRNKKLIKRRNDITSVTSSAGKPTNFPFLLSKKSILLLATSSMSTSQGEGWGTCSLDWTCSPLKKTLVPKNVFSDPENFCAVSKVPKNVYYCSPFLSSQLTQLPLRQWRLHCNGKAHQGDKIRSSSNSTVSPRNLWQIRAQAMLLISTYLPASSVSSTELKGSWINTLAFTLFMPTLTLSCRQAIIWQLISINGITFNTDNLA